MNSSTIIGIAGMCALVFAFVLEEFTTHTKKEQKKFTLLNIVGACLLLYYAVTIRAIPFIILNGIWVLIGLRVLIKKF